MKLDTKERIERYAYPEGPETAASLWKELIELVPNGPDDGAQEPGLSDLSDAHGGEEPKAVNEEESALELRRSFEAGREQGVQEGRGLERDAQAVARQAEENRRAEQMASLLRGFATEQTRYFREIEREVVSLALAIAARILRREAQMDPLLLQGAVRVALGQLSSATTVSLRVPEAELGLWKEAVAHLPKPCLQPSVAAGDGMRLGDCVVETEVGSVDLGIRAQLNEIERGFFDGTSPARKDREASLPGKAAAPGEGLESCRTSNATRRS
jgi:flagellar assembly protein FliH